MQIAFVIPRLSIALAAFLLEALSSLKESLRSLLGLSEVNQRAIRSLERTKKIVSKVR